MYLPREVRTNADLRETLGIDDDWILERTGIRERRVCSLEGGEWPSDMACHAARDALGAAGLGPDDLDMILLATVTPDQRLPSTACIVQRKLGAANRCAALDIVAACSGFVYGVAIADSLIKTGLAGNVLVVGSELLTQEIDQGDRNTCVLFGDGCGACVLGRGGDGDGDVLASHLNAEGAGAGLIAIPAGGAVQPITREVLDAGGQYMTMQGREMFKAATRTLAETARAVLEKAGVGVGDVDWVVPHQANRRILEATERLLGLPPGRMVVNIDRYGNTSSATVPIALHEAVSDGRIKRGDLVLLVAFGAGLTGGAALLRY